MAAYTEYMANWYKNAQLGMSPRMARYRTTVIIEARVPENQDRNAESQAAKAKAEELFQAIQGVIGDDAVALDPSAVRLGNGLAGDDVNW